MKKQITFTRTQLEAARKPLWHTAGNGLLTMDDATEWLAEAGIAPYVPLTDKLPAPAPSFMEAVLGRPEKGYTPTAAVAEVEEPTEDESYAVEVEEREDEDEIVGDEDEEDIDDQDEEESGDEVEEVSEDESEEAEDEESGDEVEAVDKPAEEVEAEAAPKPAPVVINGFDADEVASARRMLARMVAEGAAVPLNLLGNNGEVPDFVCSPQAFSFVYTLRGDKTWKQPPSTSAGQSVSPLALHVWESLKDKGDQTALDLATEMGAGITGAAVVRALNELWQIGRVIPVPTADGSPVKWELTSTKFTRPIKAGTNAGLPTAISALMSLYLPQAVAASSDEIETFLSPLAPRSRVREIVNNLHQTKQLESTVVDGKTLFFIPDTLPEFPQVQEPVVDRGEQVSRYERAPSKYPVRTPAGKRESGGEGERERRPFTRRDDGGSRPPRREFGGDRPQRDFTKPWDEERAARGPRREGGDRPAFSRPREGGERRPFTPREGGERRPFTPREGGERRPYAGGGDRERRPFTPREGGDRPRRPFGGDREGGRSFGGDRERRPFTPREGGERRPFTPRGDGERRPFTPREGGDRRPFTPREGGERRPFTPREGGERRPFTPRGDGERRPFTPREGGDRPRRPFGGDREGGPRRSFGSREGGERRPFTPREGGERRPFTPREGGERRPFTPREGGERRPFTPRGDGERRPFTPREGGDRPRRPFTPRGDGERRPFTPREGGERRPFTPREGGERRPFTPREGGDRPRSSFGGDRPKFGGKPGGFGRKPGFGGGPRKGPGSGPGRGGAPKRGNGR